MRPILSPLLLVALLWLCQCGNPLDIDSRNNGQGSLEGDLGNPGPEGEPSPGGQGNTGGNNGGGTPSLPTGPTRGFIALDRGSDTGRSNTDGITNDNTPTFYGSVDPNCDVWVEASLQNVGSGRSDSVGNFRITVRPLSDGAHVIRARWIYQGEIRSTPPL